MSTIWIEWQFLNFNLKNPLWQINVEQTILDNY